MFRSVRCPRVTVVLCDLFCRHFVFWSQNTESTCKPNLKVPINYVQTITYATIKTFFRVYNKAIRRNSENRLSINDFLFGIYRGKIILPWYKLAVLWSSKHKINLNNSFNKVLVYSVGLTAQATRPSYREQQALITLCESWRSVNLKHRYIH